MNVAFFLSNSILFLFFLLDRDPGLEDTATLDAPTDLSLVLVPFADVSRQQASDLPGAACQGWIAEAPDIP